MQNRRNESGVALIVTLLTLTVFTLMTLGFYFMVNGEQQTAGSEADNTIAFYGGEGALENMSFQIATLFSHTVSPTPAQINSLETQPPAIPNVTFPTASSQFPNGGYYIGYTSNGSGGIFSTPETIGGTGPLAGLQGVVTPFTLTAIADGPNNTEAKLIRQVQEVAVPIFEFGIFSNNDLAFFAGPNFNFGGRVATNGNLYLTEGPGNTLELPSKVTAFDSVVTEQLENGWTTGTNYGGTVNVVTTPGNFRSLATNEGSVIGGPTSAPNSNWRTISLTDYNGNIETSTTGVKTLNMSFAIPGSGSQPIQIIQRAQSSDSTLLSQARLENQASARILLSDTTADLPDGTGAVSLNTAFGSWYTVDACHPPLAMSPGPVPVSGQRSFAEQDDDFLTPTGSPLIGGYIEIDLQNGGGTWQNVTQEVLQQGIVATSELPPSGHCRNHPVVHLEEVNQYNCNPNPGTPNPGSSSGPCVINPTSAYDFVPINMYDTREGNVRDSNNNNIYLGGMMNVIELDVGNLQWWFASDSTGQQAANNGGYIVYFSDRRGNFDPGAGETGNYGNEDIVNPSSSSGAPDGAMEAPEDVDGPNANTGTWASDTFDTYGATPSCWSTSSPDYPCPTLPAGYTTWQTILGSTPTNPTQTTVGKGEAEKNAVIYFRHALRLVNGALGNLPPLTTANCSIARGASGSGGFTVASENPVYILGDYNASAAGGSTFSDVAGACHVPAAVMGDAVMLLSNRWSDANSFNNPTRVGSRAASTTYYRTAIMGGTNIPFLSYQSGTTTPLFGYSYPQDFGTDGGVHNFLRMLENWGGQTLYYNGSIVDFYYSRQATGVYKCCNTVYSPPTRAYSFDTDFQNIATLPPGTPRFTAVNALGFQQVVQANK